MPLLWKRRKRRFFTRNEGIFWVYRILWSAALLNLTRLCRIVEGSDFAVLGESLKILSSISETLIIHMTEAFPQLPSRIRVCQNFTYTFIGLIARTHTRTCSCTHTHTHTNTHTHINKHTCTHVKNCFLFLPSWKVIFSGETNDMRVCWFNSRFYIVEQCRRAK